MKFSQLNPMLTFTAPAKWHELCFDCPTCPGKRICIHVSIDGVPQGDSVWGLKLAASLSWDDVSIVPSINNATAYGHGRIPCRAHISITDGNVVLS